VPTQIKKLSFATQSLEGQAGFSDKIENGAHLLLAEAFDVYMNVANPESYRYLISRRFAPFNRSNTPVVNSGGLLFGAQT
jgi:hypothetical protein